MAYLKLGSVDFSTYCSSLQVNKVANYTAQTNAAGNTVVDYINHKRTIEAGIIPLDSATMSTLQNIIGAFSISISFQNPVTGKLEENVSVIIPESNVEYYTIQANKVLYKACKLKFVEL
jgi:hypothetical protein